MATSREEAVQRRASRRFTTMEGWREIRSSLYYVAGQGFISLSIDPKFEAEHHDEDGDVVTRQSSHPQQQSSLWRAHLQRPQSIHFVHNRLAPTDPFADPVSEDHKHEDGDATSVGPISSETGSDEKLRSRPVSDDPYHVFPARQRWLVVITIGLAGLFSGLSSNIYFPALDAIAQDLNVSVQLISLTITSYLVIQGVSPVIWGSFADAVGRRPIYIASFSVYIIANIALSFSPNFTILLLFRGLQAAGSASTVSIGNGVIQDISPPAQRGAYISFYQAIRNFSIAVGPVLGGALSNSFGFRSIFVFLLIISCIVLAIIVVFLPETMRSIAGNGSLRLGGIYQPVVRLVTKEPDYIREPEENIVRKKITFTTFTDPLKLLTQKDILLNLVFGGLVYTIWSMVTSTTTTLFKSAFGLDELHIGLCFLPNGLGTIVGSTIIGKLMNKDFKAAEAAYKSKHNLPHDYQLPAKLIPGNFPIERARLKNLPWITIIFIFSTGLYGFTLANALLTSLPGWITVPLMLQFLIAATSNAVFAMNQTVISDLCPGKGASSTAINNLVRCGLAAIGVAFAETMVAVLGPAVSFLLLAFIVIIAIPIAVISWCYGPGWRRERLQKQMDRFATKSANV